MPELIKLSYVRREDLKHPLFAFFIAGDSVSFFHSSAPIAECKTINIFRVFVPREEKLQAVA